MSISPERLTEMKQAGWLRTLLSGRPHFIIGSRDNPYMLRWLLIPRNRFFNVFLHKICRDDDDRALHDHPWWFVSILLRGDYLEWRDEEFASETGCRTIERHAFSSAFRRANTRHRIQLFPLCTEPKRPCWTLVFTGPKIRQWGFWCPKGFVPSEVYCLPTDEGQIGRGCD
jgi:hypothetical protein